MYIAILSYKRSTYDGDGSSTKVDTHVIKAETKETLDFLIENNKKNNVYTHRGDFNMIISESTLESIDIHETI